MGNGKDVDKMEMPSFIKWWADKIKIQTCCALVLEVFFHQGNWAVLSVCVLL